MNLSGILSQPWLAKENKRGLGTFSGVYLPSILQMLGVVLFMRLGWITGHIGPLKMCLIIFMASSILFITSLSMTSIVTNMRVGSGGSYYMISRSLGMEFGSAIGILLSVSQVTTCAICISGFALTLKDFFPDYSPIILELYTIGILSLISFFPVNLAARAQGIIFLVVLAAIASIFLGSSEAIPSSLEPQEIHEFLGFWAAFALFFPASTGIESGMAMSGDLRSPSRSLVIGTIGAVLTAYLIYVALSIFLSIQIPSSLLRSYPMITQYLSKSAPIFMLGIWGATLSSGLGSLLTAPRTLQALSQDKILPSLVKPTGIRLIMIGVITFLVVFIDMNHLLPILSMICLMTYGLLNFVCFSATLLQNPSWRPLFKTPLSISLIGVLACLMSMFMINAGASFITLFLVAFLCFWTTKRKLKGNWDDMRYSLYSFFASTATNHLHHLQKNPKSWRPNILALVSPLLEETNTIYFAHLLNQSKGFLTYGATLQNKQNAEEAKATFSKYFEQKNIPCFFHFNVHEKKMIGNQSIIQNYGLGPLQPNTLILKNPLSITPEFCQLLLDSFALEKNIILLKIDETNSAFRDEKIAKQIDLWWGGKYHRNFELSLALAQIIQNSKTWMGANIMIKTLVPNQAAKIHVTKLFEKYHQALRFKNLFLKPYLDASDDFYEHIEHYAKESSLTLLGVKAPEVEESLEAYTAYFKKLMEKTKHLASVAYVLAGENLDFQKIFE